MKCFLVHQERCVCLISVEKKRAVWLTKTKKKREETGPNPINRNLLLYNLYIRGKEGNQGKVHRMGIIAIGRDYRQLEWRSNAKMGVTVTRIIYIF